MFTSLKHVKINHQGQQHATNRWQWYNSCINTNYVTSTKLLKTKLKH